MEIVSLTENDINCINNYVEEYSNAHGFLGPIDIKAKLFDKKCGELAFMKYGMNNCLFAPTAGNIMHESVLDTSDDPIHSHGILINVNDMKYHHMRMIVDVHVYDENSKAIMLNASEYDEHLNKKNWFPIDVFVFVKKLSVSTYDMAGFIRKEEAFKFYKKYYVPGDLNTYYGIDEKYMKTSFVNCIK